MKRVLAILVAVGLIAGAYLLRTRVIRPDDAGGDATEVPGAAQPPEEGLVVVCATEVGAACRAVEGAQMRVEPAGDTADALVGLARGQEPDFDAWVTGASWPGLVDELRRAGGLPALFADDPPMVARSRLALAIEEGRQDGVDAVCAEVAWDCLATAVGRPWSELGADEPGTFQLLAQDPEDSLAGLALLGQASSGFFGRTQFGSQDFDGDFRAWLTGLARGLMVVGLPVRQLVANPAAADAAVALDVEAQADVAAAIRGNRTPPVILYAGPEVVVDVVAAAVGSEGSSVEPLVQPLQAALVEAGWLEPGAAAGATPLPDGDGLPAPGVMAALRQQWAAVR